MVRPPAGRRMEFTRRGRLRQPGWSGRVARSQWRWRRATRRWRVLPDFVILGAQKAGTSSLFDWLIRHPDAAAPWIKELHHFNAARQRPLDEYRSGFPLAVRARRPLRRRGWITGESTPEYLYTPWAPPRMAAELPESTRFLVVLREPLARLRSHHAMAVRNGWQQDDLPAALVAERQRLEKWGWGFDPGPGGRDDFLRRSYLARGLYADQLERWFEVVDRNRILVLRFEELATDPAHLAPAIEEFLGLGPALAGVPFPHSNPAPAGGAGDRRNDEARDGGGPVDAVAEAVGDFYDEPNRRLADLVGISWDDQVAPRG